MNFDHHKNRMIQHFLYLRQRDEDYARAAFKAYTALPHCPFPLIAEDVRLAWQALQAPTSQAG